MTGVLLCLTLVLRGLIIKTVWAYADLSLPPREKYTRGVQPAACGLHAAQDGCERGPTQNRKFT